MSLSDLALLGTFVSGIAVLFSIAFLALQLRQGNVNQRALIQLERSARVIDGIYKRTDPHLAGIVLRGNKGDTSLSLDEIDAYLQMTYAMFLVFENTYLQLGLGTVLPDQWETATARLRFLLPAPGRRIAWKKFRHMFGGDYVKAIDQIIAETRSASWEEPATSWVSDVNEEARRLGGS
jgi:hypothetical protein